MKEHHETVDPDPLPGRRRHPVLERPEVILVHEMGLLVAPLALAELLVEPRPLVHRVVQLGERVRDLPAADDQLEPVDDLRPFVVAPRERRDVDRVFRDEGRPDDLLLGHLLVDRDQQIPGDAVPASLTPSVAAVSRRYASSDRRSSGNPPWRAAACATVGAPTAG